MSDDWDQIVLSIARQCTTRCDDQRNEEGESGSGGRLTD